MVLDVSLLNTQDYKLRNKVSRAIQMKGYRHPLQLDVVATEKGAFGSTSTAVSQLKSLIDR